MLTSHRHPQLVPGRPAACQRRCLQDPCRQQVRLGRKACTYLSQGYLHIQVVTTEQGQELANELGMQYIETSAKANTNVDEAFFKLAQQVKDHLIDQGITTNAQSTSGTTTIGGAGAGLDATGKKGGCC